MTKFTKKDQLNSSWYEIDAENAVVGRLATVVSNIIRGKNKTTYTPHMDDGDFVVVKNIEQIKFTGKKFQDKKYEKIFVFVKTSRAPDEWVRKFERLTNFQKRRSRR